MITIGIDPHKSSLTAVAVDSSGEPVNTTRMAVTATTVRQLQQWAVRWPQRRWAVKGTEGLGRGVAQGLTAAGEQVVDVPAQLAARARLLNSGHARKTDALDAASVAAVAVHHPRLRQVCAEDHSVGLRLLSDRRACQDRCVRDHLVGLVEVGGEPVGVGQGEGSEGLFPALDAGSFDEPVGGFTLVAG